MTKCLIDSNILISASLFPESVPSLAFMKASTYPNTAVVCDFTIDECRRVYNRKFKNRIPILERFLSIVLLSVQVVATPPDEAAYHEEALIRDLNDRPILRAAIESNVDIIITGDKDFLESGIKIPRIITAVQFVNMI